MIGQHVEQPRLQVGIGTSGFVAVKIILQICFFSPPTALVWGSQPKNWLGAFGAGWWFHVVPGSCVVIPKWVRCGSSMVGLNVMGIHGWCRIFRTYHLCHWGYHLGLFSSSDNILSCFGSRECSFATLQISRSN